MRRQRFKKFRRPVAGLLFGRASGIELGHGSFPKNRSFEIELGAKLGKHRREKNLIFSNAQRLGGFHYDVDVTGGFGMNQLIGQLCCHGRHEVPMLAKKRNVLMVGGSLQRVDLDGIRAPVLKKNLQDFLGKLSRSQLLHKGPVGHSFLPALGDFAVMLIDQRFGLPVIDRGRHLILLYLLIVTANDFFSFTPFKIPNEYILILQRVHIRPRNAAMLAAFFHLAYSNFNWFPFIAAVISCLNDWRSRTVTAFSIPAACAILARSVLPAVAVGSLIRVPL